MTTTNEKNLNINETKKEKTLYDINPEELLTTDAADVELIKKGFSELTESDLKKHQSFLAKVYEKEIKTGFGKAQEVKKIWMFAMKVAPTVILERSLTEEEISAIRALNPKLINNKAVVKVPAKCISGVTEDGRRFFRILACLCHAVYFGSSRNNKRNNGFLSNLQVTNLVVNNRNVKSHPELVKVKFVDISNELLNTIEEDYTDNLVNSNDEF